MLGLFQCGGTNGQGAQDQGIDAGKRHYSPRIRVWPHQSRSHCESVIIHPITGPVGR